MIQHTYYVLFSNLPSKTSTRSGNADPILLFCGKASSIGAISISYNTLKGGRPDQDSLSCWDWFLNPLLIPFNPPLNWLITLATLRELLFNTWLRFLILRGKMAE